MTVNHIKLKKIRTFTLLRSFESRFIFIVIFFTEIKNYYNITFIRNITFKRKSTH